MLLAEKLSAKPIDLTVSKIGILNSTSYAIASPTAIELTVPSNVILMFSLAHTLCKEYIVLEVAMEEITKAFAA